MNLTKLCILALICLCSVQAGATDVKTENLRLYKTLDSLTEHQGDIIREKEERIRIITDGMGMMTLNDEQTYQVYKRLYDEYVAFQFDSAYAYINRCMDLQQRIARSASGSQHFNHADLNAECRIALAHILAVTGIFRKAQQMLDGIDARQLTAERRVEYYNQLGELNLYRSEMAENTSFFSEYIDSAQYYRQLILQIAPKDSYDFIFNQATYTCEQGDADRAIRQLEQYLPRLHEGERRYGIVTSTLAFFYSMKENAPMQEHYLLLSAISDVRGAILENNSLRELSAILLARGEYAKAYNYMQLSSEDAKNYGSRLRSLQVARMAPLIIKAYDMERSAAERRTRYLLWFISVIAALMVCSVVYCLSLVKKRHLTNEKMSRMNTELASHNEQMQLLNRQMKESNRLKDEYIGRFLELSSTLIHRGEEKMKQLNRLARDRKLEDLYDELKNPKGLSDGIRLFHQNFDTAFLNIYPNFTEEVNRLLTAEGQFEVTKDATRLTTELRVLALIRLGISDNQKIADILRSSLTTIYTYRSKLKARALRKETFEDDIRRIATYE